MPEAPPSPRPRVGGTRALRGCLAVIVGVTFVLGTANAAFAHTTLQTTDPARETVLQEAPQEITLAFDEPVEAGLSSVRVLRSDGERIQASAPKHPGDDPLRLSARVDDLSPGTYVVAWRAMSADGHPVRGAFTFQLGSGPIASTSQLASDLLASGEGDSATGVALGIWRFALYLSLAGLCGGSLLILWLWRDGRDGAGGRRYLVGAWVGSVVATAVTACLQGAQAAALPVMSAFSPSALADIAGTRFGRSSVVRLVLLALLAGVMWRVKRVAGSSPRRFPTRVLATVLILAVLVTVSVSGHAMTGSGRPIRLVTDVLHLLAAVTWIGGLGLIVAGLFGRDHGGDSGIVLSRFSPVAVVCVVVLASTGSIRAWMESGSLHALTTSPYGSVLGWKVALFAFLVGVATLTWRRTRRRKLADVSMPGLRGGLGVEVAIGVAVLLLASLLVNATPARSLPGKPFAAEMTGADLLVDVSIDAAKVGTTQFHFFFLTPAGRLKDVEKVKVDLRLPSKDVGPMDVPLRSGGPGHFFNDSVRLPLAGRWSIDVVVTTEGSRTQRVSTEVVVR